MELSKYLIVAYLCTEGDNKDCDPDLVLAYAGDVFPVIATIGSIPHVSLRGEMLTRQLWPMPGDYSLHRFEPVRQERMTREMHKRIVPPQI